MLPITFNPLITILSLTAAFGVFMHDTKLDAATAVAVPVVVAYSGESNRFKSADPHVHMERVSFARHLQAQPALQPRNEYDRKYADQRRFLENGFGSSYHWPSI